MILWKLQAHGKITAVHQPMILRTPVVPRMVAAAAVMYPARMRAVACTRAGSILWSLPQPRYQMKVVASVTEPSAILRAAEEGADMIELRLDLFSGDPVQGAAECRELTDLPFIATLRSVQEGGKFMGDPGRWIEMIRAVLPMVEFVDIEARFEEHAGLVRDAGKTIIASVHIPEMPSLPELFALERMLRSFGDIPKIAVRPKSPDDLINLISFTNAAAKPVCTSIMGAGFRHARAILPLFGSEFVYCHAGNPTAQGQYSVKEFRELMRLLRME
jgi:3-dehydroquinate dehydratase-1